MKRQKADKSEVLLKSFQNSNEMTVYDTLSVYVMNTNPFWTFPPGSILLRLCAGVDFLSNFKRRVLQFFI